MNIKKLCKETAILKVRAGFDDHGQPIYIEGISIKCLIMDKTKIVSDGKEEKFVNYSDIVMIGTASVGDLINDRPIQAIEKIKDKKGKLLGMEAYLL